MSKVLLEVMANLEQEEGSKSKLMQKYSNRQQEILKLYGGNISDILVDPEHEYHQIQHKLSILNGLKV